MKLTLIPYDKEYLELSWIWLNDPEIKELTMTPKFTKEDQLVFFSNLVKRKDYFIWGLSLDCKRKIGACGLKNISNSSAEYWGYIGEKDLWGKGLGSSMMQLVQNEADKIGINSLYLNVSKENLRAITLYKKYGYSIESEKNNIFKMRFYK